MYSFDFLASDFDGVLIWLNYGGGEVLGVRTADVKDVRAAQAVLFDLPTGSLVQFKADKIGKVVFG